MTGWHQPREHCYCRQCNAVRVKEEIERVLSEKERTLLKASMERHHAALERLGD